MLLGYRSLFLNLKVWRLAWRRCFCWPMLFWVVARFSIALFAWSAGFVGAATTSVINETWPVIHIALAGWLFRGEVRYRRIGSVIYLAFMLALCGVAVVVLSRAELFTITTGNSSSVSAANLMVGVLLALCGAVLTGMNAFGLRWAVSLARELPASPGCSQSSLELFAVSFGTMLANLVAAPAVALVGIGRGEASDLGALSLSLTVVALVDLIAMLNLARGNLLTGRLSVNVMSYFTPLLSLSLLYMFGQVGDVNLMLLLAGAGVIISANVLVFIQDRSVRE